MGLHDGLTEVVVRTAKTTVENAGEGSLCICFTAEDAAACAMNGTRGTFVFIRIPFTKEKRSFSWREWDKSLLLRCETYLRTIMSTQSMTQTIAEYFKTQPVLKAWLFGSYSRGEETPLSDVDILVNLDHSQPIGLKFFRMWNDLERLLDRRVDLVEDGELLPFAEESANRDKYLIYERTA